MTKHKRKLNETKSVSSSKKRQRNFPIVNFGPYALPSNLLLWIFFHLELFDLGRLSQVNKAMARCFFSLGSDHSFWLKLSEIHKLEEPDASLCYKPFRSNYEFLYTPKSRNPGPLILYLNMGALQICPKCGINSGQISTSGLPISIYEGKLRKSKSKKSTKLNVKPPVYCCINPKCDYRLDRKLGQTKLRVVFDLCPKNHKHFDTKPRCFAEFEADIFRPNSKKVLDDGFSYCRHCGLLKRQLASSRCPTCKKTTCECDKCICCKSRKCKCILCAECDGCKVRAHQNPCTCKERFCRDCDLELEECECPSSSEDESF